MNDASTPFKPAPAGSPQLALSQLMAGLLNHHNAPVHVTLDVLLSMYRHIALQCPEQWPSAMTGLQVIHAEIAARQHLVDLSNQMPVTRPN